jgi:hypothetical protein
MNPDCLVGFASSVKSLGSQTYLAVSRSEMPAPLLAALSELLPVWLLDVGGEAEKRFYAAYTGTEEKAGRLHDEINRRFPTLPRTPLLMKLVAIVYNESGQVPSSLGSLFERYVADLVARAKARRGFSEERGIEILGQAAAALKNRGVTASPLEILKVLSRAGIYARNRHYFTAAHDLLEDYFAALVLDREWDDEGRQSVLACRSNPKLEQVWELPRQIRPEAES